MSPPLVLDLETIGYQGYRLDGLWFWSLPLLAVICCMLHAARRAFRQPEPAAAGRSITTPEGNGIQAVIEGMILRYRLSQRIFHWINASSSILLLFSGLALYHPELFSLNLPPALWFTIHRWFAIILAAGIIFHILDDALIHDGFAFMELGGEVRASMGNIVKNFLGISRFYPRYRKYHPMQVCTHWMMAGSVFGLILTGMILWRPVRGLLPLNLFGLGWDEVFFCRILHDLFASAFLALLTGHLYFAILIKKNWMVSKTMLTGTISVEKYAAFHEITGELVPAIQAAGSQPDRPAGGEAVAPSIRRREGG